MFLSLNMEFFFSYELDQPQIMKKYHFFVKYCRKKFQQKWNRIYANDCHEFYHKSINLSHKKDIFIVFCYDCLLTMMKHWFSILNPELLIISIRLDDSFHVVAFLSNCIDVRLTRIRKILKLLTLFCSFFYDVLCFVHITSQV